MGESVLRLCIEQSWEGQLEGKGTLYREGQEVNRG